MRNITTVIEGSVVAFDIGQNDLSATSASMYLKNVETGETITGTANYVSRVATIEFDGSDTAVPGVYRYQVNENLSGGGIAKYGAFDCDQDGDCEYGYVVICEALDGGIS